MASAVQAAHRRQWQGWIIGIALATLLAQAGQAEHSNPNHNGDFDGDGCMDPAVYNESTGEWQTLMNSSDYEPESFILGGPGWSAIQGDYNGDGKADPVAYHRSTGVWTAMLSSLAYNTGTIAFGGDGWNVVPDNFDGDGLGDSGVAWPDNTAGG